MDKRSIVFKSEDSLWQMMADVGLNGRSAKPFNMRRWDMADERIYRLSWGTHLEKTKQLEPGQTWGSIGGIPRPVWTPDEKEVWFVNKATGELLGFEYLGLEFADWAPRFCFLLLGKRFHPPLEEDPD
jgi:hypothetical protein